MKHGTYIAIEGMDGCGKTTLITLLKEHLIKENIPAVFTKEPGGSAIGKPLNALLQLQKSVSLDAKTEYLLFAADRAQHRHEMIKPLLEAGNIIISDRWADSSLAYQGYGLGLNKKMIRQINQWAMNNIQPDLVIYLHINPEQSMERIRAHRSELTTCELRPLSFWKKVYQGYSEIFKGRTNIVTIDATNDPATVMKQAWDAIQKHL